MSNNLHSFYWFISVIIFKGLTMIDLNSENCKLLESVTNDVVVKMLIAIQTFSTTIYCDFGFLFTNDSSHPIIQNLISLSLPISCTDIVSLMLTHI